MAYNTTASWDKSTCTNYMDFENCHNRFGQFSWSKIDSNYLDVNLKVFKRNENRDFRLVENLTMGEADFNRFIRLRNQLIIAVENFAGEENMSPVLIPLISKGLDEQLELAHVLVIEVLDRAIIKVCVTLLRYNLEKSESSYDQGQLLAMKKEEDKFH